MRAVEKAEIFDMDRKGLPPAPSPVRVRQTTRKINAKEGIKRPVEKFGWMSDGPLRPIEAGIPLFLGSEFSRPLVDSASRERKIMELEAEINMIRSGDSDERPLSLSSTKSSTKEKFESSDVGTKKKAAVEEEEEEEIDLEKIAMKVRPKSKLTNWEKRIIEKKRRQKTDLIDGIAPLKLRRVNKKNIRPIPTGVSPFYHARRIERTKKFLPKISGQSSRYDAGSARSTYSTKRPNSELSELSTVPLLKYELSRVFQVGHQPFEGVDCDEDFPYDNEEIEQFLNQINEEKKRNRNEVANENEKNDNINIIKDSRFDIPYGTTLIDTSQYDVFWTKNKVPFTRADAELLYTWQYKCDSAIEAADKRRLAALQKREAALKRTFESRAAFEKATILADQEAERITFAGAGKCKTRHKESFWEKAARVADHDNSSLKHRRLAWARFIKQGTEKKILPAPKGSKEEEFVQKYRSEVMKGVALSHEMFWNVISVLGKLEFAQTEICILVEILRRQFRVHKSDVVGYLERNGFPTYFFELAGSQLEN